jgi:uncharacterized membrane protein
MTWRSPTTPADRIFGAIAYLMPLVEGISFGFPLMAKLPILAVILSPIAPLWQIYNGIPFFGLILFFGLYILVVNNDRISRFIRFNVMQAILIGIVISLCSLIIAYVLRPFGGFVIETLTTTVFLGVLVASVYGMVQSALGRYAEIPSLSEAVNMRVR